MFDCHEPDLQLLSSILSSFLSAGSSEDDEISHIQGCSFVMLPIFGFRGEIYKKKDIAHVLLSFALMLLWQST